MQEMKLKEVYRDEAPVTIDGKQSTITADTSFNTKAGTITVTLKMTTKQFSFNEDQAEAAKTAATRLLDQVYDAGLQKLERWLDKERPGADPKQLSIFEVIKNHSRDDDEGEPAVDDEAKDTTAKVRVRRN